MPQSVLITELINQLLSVLAALVVLLFGGFIGQRLTVFWALKQRRRELVLAALDEYYRLYGEFFAVWKLWAYYLDSLALGCLPGLETPETTRWQLLERACASEGKLESLFVKLAAERKLSSQDVEILGKFRQAYQSLRQAIRDNEHLDWFSQDHPQYLSFKRLAALVARLILSQSEAKSGDAVTDELAEITAGRWEIWVIAEEDWRRLRAEG